MAGQFLDSNVLVYAFTADPRGATARALLHRGCGISVQSLNEFANVARRKLGLPWQEVREALSAIRVLCPNVLPIDIATHGMALDLAERHGFALFDALIVAAVLQADGDTLWSEDMHHGILISGKLRILNPFRTV